MFFRHDRYYETKTLSADATWSDVLPEGGFLDHILVTVRSKNNASQYSSPEPLILDHISKIEVKGDGKEPLKDYWGQSCLAEYAYATGKQPPGMLDVMSANYQTQTYPIFFGRYPFDGEYALDLAALDETRLDITNDFQSDDYDGSNLTMDVDLYFLENPATAPSHFFQTYEKTTHTWTASSQKKVFSVPTKDKIRRMMIGCKSARTSATSGPGNKGHRNCRHVKYTYNSGGIILRDDDLFRHDQDHLWGYPEFINTYGLGESRATYYIDSLLCRPLFFVAQPTYSAAGTNYGSIKTDNRVERFQVIRAAETAGEQHKWRAGGYGFLDHLLIREDRPDTPEGYLDPEARKKVELEIGNSSSGATSGNLRFVIQALKEQPT